MWQSENHGCVSTAGKARKLPVRTKDVQSWGFCKGWMPSLWLKEYECQVPLPRPWRTTARQGSGIQEVSRGLRIADWHLTTLKDSASRFRRVSLKKNVTISTYFMNLFEHIETIMHLPPLFFTSQRGISVKCFSITLFQNLKWNLFF